MIYLDNAATTKMFEQCVDIYRKYACESFYNPSAVYTQGIANYEHLDEVRKTILTKLGVNKGNIIFTSGATESNNLAIRGSLRSGKYEYIFSQGEHASVNALAHELENNGYIVHFVELLPNGQVDYDKLKSLINDKTRLISVIHVSNETGAINDIQKLCELKKLAPNCLLHIDGVQAFCKIPFSLQNLDVDFYTISAHKFHGPKGVGALYVKNKNSLKSIIFGGEQEYGKRSGTQNLPAIMATKCAIDMIDVEKNFENVTRLKKAFLNTLKDEKIKVFSQEDSFSPYIISLSFEGVNGETLMRALEKEVVVGIGSACSSRSAGNRVLEKIGLSKDRVKSSIRVSFNAYMTEEEVIKAGNIILKTYREIWKKVK